MNGYRVAQKRRPKWDADKFFVSFQGGLKTMVPNKWYGDFGPLDILWFENEENLYESAWWLNTADREQGLVIKEVEKEIIASRLVETQMGYVAKPRKIGEQWWYLAKTGDAWWECKAEIAAKCLPELLQTTYGHYATLGVLPTATTEEILKAFRALDTQEGLSVEEHALIDKACDILANPRRRQEWESKATGRAGTIVMPWPGNGAGTISCKVEKRGETWSCTEVLEFVRAGTKHTTKVSWKNVYFSSSGVSLVLRSGVQVGLGIQELPFVPTDAMQVEKAEFEFPGPTVCEKTCSTLRWQGGQAVPMWEDPVFDVDWGEAGDILLRRSSTFYADRDTFRVSIRRQVRAEGYMSFEDCQAFSLAAGMHADMGMSALWDGFNLEHAGHIEELYIKDKWACTKRGLMFRLVNDLVVLEMPEGSTHVFLLSMPVQELAQRLNEVDTVDLLVDEDLQVELGWCGVALSKLPLDVWKDTLESIIEEGSDW